MSMFAHRKQRRISLSKFRLGVWIAQSQVKFPHPRDWQHRLDFVWHEACKHARRLKGQS